MKEQNIKSGYLVRLTDPLDNGTIVRIENVDENGFAEWLTKNDFEFRVGDKDDKDFYLYCDDVVEISATLHNEEAG